MKAVPVLCALALTFGLGLTSLKSDAAENNCHSRLLASCDCSCINRGEEGSGDCITIQECLESAGMRGKVTCYTTPSESFSECSSPPCPQDCAVIYNFQPEAE